VESTLLNDRTIHNNKPDIIICDNVKETCMLIDVVISGDRNVVKKEAEQIPKCKRSYNRNGARVECENKCDNSNNRDNWNRLKIIYKMPE
jgi:hypothetical protein